MSGCIRTNFIVTSSSMIRRVDHDLCRSYLFYDRLRCLSGPGLAIRGRLADAEVLLQGVQQFTRRVHHVVKNIIIIIILLHDRPRTGFYVFCPLSSLSPSSSSSSTARASVYEWYWAAYTRRSSFYSRPSRYLVSPALPVIEGAYSPSFLPPTRVPVYYNNIHFMKSRYFFLLLLF